MLKTIIITLTILFSTTLPCQAQELFRKGTLTIHTQSGKRIPFNIEIADTLEKRRQGLMHRRFLPKESGMLFNHGKEKWVSAWMKNTYIPLDMLFISKDKKIVDIVENTTPLSEKYIDPKYPVQYMLELNAGTVKTLELQIGDRINYESRTHTATTQGQ